MPRMSKKRKEEWVFFLNDRGRITYNALCRKCVYNCTSSYWQDRSYTCAFLIKTQKGYKKAYERLS